MKLKTINKGIGVVVLLMLLNVLASEFFYRIDFTSDQRYTLSKSSLDLINSLEKPVVISVYLTGDLPSEFNRLQTETRYMLEELQAYNSNLKFRFIDPLETDEDAMTVANRFYENGMSPESLNIRKNGQLTERLIFPWAVAEWNGKQVSIPLLQKTLDQSNAEIIQKSIQNLEYTFIDGITKLKRERRQKIAILKGQGELEDRYISDFLKTLKDYYLIAPFTLDSVETSPQQTLKNLSIYDLIIDAKATETFSDEKKYVIDQYLMNGGKAIWLTEHVKINKDSLYTPSKESLALPVDLNLYSLFFKYGIRINPQLINDLYSAPIILASGRGNSTQLSKFPWFYDPLGSPAHPHPITSNLNQVKFEFANPIDTIKSNLKKTILLESSELSRLIGVPYTISLNEVTKEPDPRLYTQGHFPLAVLVEGEFTSAFKNKLRPIQLKTHLNKSPYTQQVFISDGDVIKNQIQSGEVLELGFDRYTGLTFGNKTFLLNIVNYMLGDENLVKIRSKSVNLDQMNLERLQAERTQWQILNLAIPALIILSVIGIASYLRKRKYTKS